MPLRNFIHLYELPDGRLTLKKPQFVHPVSIFYITNNKENCCHFYKDVSGMSITIDDGAGVHIDDSIWNDFDELKRFLSSNKERFVFLKTVPKANQSVLKLIEETESKKANRLNIYTVEMFGDPKEIDIDKINENSNGE